MSCLDAEVLEACILGARNGWYKGKVRPRDIHRRIRLSDPNGYAALSVDDVRASMRTIFGVSANRKKRTNFFTISRRSAIRHFETNGIPLRPLKDARECRIGRAVALERRISRTCAPLSRHGRRRWEQARGDLVWRPVLVHVDHVGQELTRIDVPQWSTARPAYIPTSTLPTALAKTGIWLVADGSIPEPEGEELYLRDFVLAPEPRPLGDS